MAGRPPESGPSHTPPGTPERLLLGLAFVASGAALGSWFAAFRLIGAVLVLIGLVILVQAGWEPLQAYLREILGPRASHQRSTRNTAGVDRRYFPQTLTTPAGVLSLVLQETAGASLRAASAVRR